MRTFDHPNYSFGFECPVCKTGADRPVTLIGIPGTERDNIMEARQVHAECAELLHRMTEADKEGNPK